MNIAVSVVPSIFKFDDEYALIFSFIWCFDYNNGNDEPVIVYYDHESAFEYEDYEPQFVCSSFRELLDNITESQEE